MDTRPVFQRATKQQAKLRLAIQGPSGSGKTYTDLILATVLANGGRVAVIDTEHGSSAKYASEFEFYVGELHSFSPKDYMDAIEAAEEAGYSVILIDSLSHEWEGAGGVMEQHDLAAEKSGNAWAAWRDPTKLHRKLVDRMLQSSCHIICTMRAKTEWFQNADKKIIEKKQVGTVQRPGMEYEFDIVLDIDYAHTMTVSKSRFTAIADATESKPGAKWFLRIRQWLSEGAPQEEQPKAVEQPKAGEAPKAEGNGHEPAKAPADSWVYDEKRRKAFHAWLNDVAKAKAVNLTYEGIKRNALHIEHLDEYLLGATDAQKAVLVYVESILAQAGNPKQGTL
jgi:hypothetical protein